MNRSSCDAAERWKQWKPDSSVHHAFCTWPVVCGAASCVRFGTFAWVARVAKPLTQQLALSWPLTWCHVLWRCMYGNWQTKALQTM